MGKLSGVLLIITGVLLFFLTEDENLFAGLLAGILLGLGFFQILIKEA